MAWSGYATLSDHSVDGDTRRPIKEKALQLSVASLTMRIGSNRETLSGPKRAHDRT